ncbi:MAG: hypothetical protein ABIJ42_08870, partial [Acidobacteriota bacterium]
MNLKYVNKLIREKNIGKALGILEELKKKNPDFFLYQQKIYECEISRNKYGLDKHQTAESFNIYQSINKNNPQTILKLAALDLIDSRYEECVKKCKNVITLDRNNLEAYRIAEQASIELKNFDDANYFFLSQPAVLNPSAPIKRDRN